MLGSFKHVQGMSLLYQRPFDSIREVIHLCNTLVILQVSEKAAAKPDAIGINSRRTATTSDCH